MILQSLLLVIYIIIFPDNFYQSGENSKVMQRLQNQAFIKK